MGIPTTSGIRTASIFALARRMRSSRRRSSRLRPKLSQSLGKPSGRIEVAAEVAGECRNRRTGLVRVDLGQVDKMAGRMADKTPSAR